MIERTDFKKAYANIASAVRWMRRHPNKKLMQREHRNYGADISAKEFKCGSPTWNKSMRFIKLSM